jgi:hypothetical protein
MNQQIIEEHHAACEAVKKILLDHEIRFEEVSQVVDDIIRRSL